jgi:hypothetical protein
MDNILFIPGIANPVSEIRQLLFGQGQPGGSWIPTLSSAMIAANSFGSGVTDIFDLSGNNNPFSQATPSSRGAWFREPKTGRVNLLIHSDDLTQSAWVKDTVTISANAVTAPDGTQTGDNVIHASAAGSVLQNVIGLTSAQAATAFVSLRHVDTQWVRLTFGDSFNNVAVWVDVQNRVLGGSQETGTATLVSSSIELQADGWVKLIASVNLAAGTNYFQLNTATGDLSNTRSVGSFSFVKSQVNTGTVAAAYQRVTTAFDVTEQGQRDCYGVRLDGTDDWYQRTIDLSGTDKVIAFAAVRRLATTGVDIIAEFSASLAANNGSFNIISGVDGPVNGFRTGSRGTAAAAADQFAGFNQGWPNTSIITTEHDIANDLTRIYQNGVLRATATGDKGAGNFGNYPLFLFARNGSSLFFNGNLYALIIAGGSYPLSTIQRVERILSRITPTVNL